MERIERGGVVLAEVIRANVQVSTTKFFSHPDSSFQFGLLAHGAGFTEPPHYHRAVPRQIDDLQQMFVVQRGIVAVDLFDESGGFAQEIILHPGDAIVLMRGIHSVRVIEDMQCISVKQGPYLGEAHDKVFVEVSR
jgi:hypothetical protein